MRRTTRQLNYNRNNIISHCSRYTKNHFINYETQRPIASEHQATLFDFSYSYQHERAYVKRPKETVINMYNEIAKEFAIFEKTYLSELHPATQLYIDNIQFNLSDIRSCISQYKRAIHNDHKIDFQSLYFAMAGLLWHGLDITRTTHDKNEELQQLILGILNKYPAAMQDSLNELAIKRDALGIYMRTQDELNCIYRKLYTTTFDNLKRKLNQNDDQDKLSIWKQYIMSAKSLLSIIDDHRYQCGINNDSQFDYRYYYHVVKNVDRIITNSLTDQTIHRKQACIDDAIALYDHCPDGKGSVPLRVLSAMVLFAGIAVITASIVCSVTIAPTFVAPVGIISGIVIATIGSLLYCANQDRGIKEAFKSFTNRATLTPNKPEVNHPQPKTEKTPLLVN